MYVQDYLARFPELGSISDLSPELLLQEFRARQASGDPVDLREYQQRFPEQFTALERLLNDSSFATPSFPGSKTDGGRPKADSGAPSTAIAPANRTGITPGEKDPSSDSLKT